MTTIAAPPVPTAPLARERAAAWVARIPAAPAIGALAGGVLLIGAGTPSYWGDEAASVMSAQRPLASLFAELGTIDAVHGAYYLFLHFWTMVAGTSEFAVRLPSAVAAGFAVAGTVVLGRRLIGRSAGVVAGIALATMPIVTRMAIEARSYSFGMAAAVWLTVLIVGLVTDRDTRLRWWLVYAVGAALSVYLFLYLALMVLVHLVVMLVLRPPRDVVVRWGESLALALVLAAPILVIGLSQHGQIAFLARRDYATVTSVFVGQWFGTASYAALAWLLILSGLVAVVLRRRALPTFARAGFVIALAWLTLPTALLLAGNTWITPMYNLRYVVFCAPAVAIVMGFGVVQLSLLARRRSLGPVIASIALAGLIAATASGYLAQRRPYGKDGGSDLRQLAAAVQANAAPGDGIVFDETVKPSRRPRLALDLYPAAFAGLDDVALATPYAQTSSIWDVVAPIEELGPRLLAHDTIWAVEFDGSASPDVARLQAIGYTVADTIPVHRTTLVELEKEPQ